MENSDEKANKFGREVANYIQVFGIKNNFRGLRNWQLKKDDIVGQFLAVSGGKIDVFNFTVNDRGLEYQLAQTHSDSYLYGVKIGSELNPLLAIRGGNSTAYAQGRLDGAIARCAIGSRCGDTCIEKKDKCKIRTPIAARHGERLVRIAKASGSGHLQSASSVKAVSTPSHKNTIAPQELTKLLHEQEDAIGLNSVETAIVIDPKTGDVLAKKGGGKTNVDFRYEEVKKWKGAILTHNHPWTENEEIGNKGVGFSSQDLHASCVAELSEVRAVTSHYRFSLKPPKEGWDEQYFKEKIAPSYKKHQQAVYLEGVEKVKQNTDPQQATTLASKLEEEWAHETIDRVSKELGMKYKREPIENVDEKAIVEQRWRRLEKFKRQKTLKQLAGLGILGAAYAAAILSQTTKNNF